MSDDRIERDSESRMRTRFQPRTRTEMNPDADFATDWAGMLERSGDVKAAQGWRNMRWGSWSRQSRGRDTVLHAEDW